MDPVTSGIVAALVAGATAAASETASQAVKDAYAGLKRILQDGYKLAAAALLEKKPSDPSFQKAVEAELAGQPEVLNDKAVLEKVQAVQETLKQASPEQLLAWGVDLGKLEAAGDVIAERISGIGGGLRASELKAGGSVRLSDISGGSSRGKS